MKCIPDITGRTFSAVDKSLFSKYYMLQVQRVYKTLLASSFIANSKVGNGETFSQTSQPKTDTPFPSLFAHNAMINITTKKQTDRQTDREAEKQTQSSHFLICDREILAVIVDNWHITL